jgi:hypothetical protein
MSVVTVLQKPPREPDRLVCRSGQIKTIPACAGVILLKEYLS